MHFILIPVHSPWILNMDHGSEHPTLGKPTLHTGEGAFPTVSRKPLFCIRSCVGVRTERGRVVEEPASKQWVPRLALGVGAWRSHCWTRQAHSSGLGLPPGEELLQVLACTRWLLRDTTLRGFLPAGRPISVLLAACFGFYPLTFGFQ